MVRGIFGDELAVVEDSDGVGDRLDDRKDVRREKDRGALIGEFAVIPRIGPLRENIATFRPVYDWFVVVFSAFMTVIHGGVIAFNLGYEFDFTLLVLAAVAGLFYYVGVLLAHADRNWFVGIRTPWTLSSDEVWERTHHLGSRLFKLTAIISLVGLFFGDAAIYSLSCQHSSQRVSR